MDVRLQKISCVVLIKTFYILLTVHLGTILVNNQLDTLSLMYLFISPLYMF